MKKGYPSKQYDQPTKRYVQFLELEDNPELIKKYKKLHSKQVHWKEIREGIKEVGILEMEIYIQGNRLVMIIDAPLDFDFDSAMQRLATLQRQQEWEETVAEFQRCAKKASSSEKWRMAERMFYLY